jgi:hypothetical protein
VWASSGEGEGEDLRSLQVKDVRTQQNVTPRGTGIETSAMAMISAIESPELPTSRARGGGARFKGRVACSKQLQGGRRPTIGRMQVVEAGEEEVPERGTEGGLIQPGTSTPSLILFRGKQIRARVKLAKR